MCTTCNVEKTEPKYTTFSSISQIEKEFKQYADNNLLGLYGRRLQVIIEKLFTLEQFHLCDLLVKLSVEKKNEARDKLIFDLESINLEQLDHVRKT